ncbi:MAG: hypothetical protein QM692_04430 [Thermomicrobiales bacterium]
MTDDPEQVIQRRAQELLDQIPGYRGYRLKEERRDADRRVRDAVADAYRAELDRVERIGRDVAKARRLGDIQPIEDASQRIRHIIDRVRTETPGYGGLFGDNPIDGVALDQIRLFDEGLMQGVVLLRADVDTLEQAAAAGQPLAPAAAAIATATDQQLLRLSTRGQVVESGRAVSGESALAALGSDAPALPAPDLVGIKPGDAVSILGDNFSVEAVIRVTGRPESFQLVRLSSNPEEWLFLGDPGRAPMRLEPADASTTGPLSVAGRDLPQVAAGTGDGEIVTSSAPGQLRAVRYALLQDAADPNVSGVVLDWDGERQALLGSPVEMMDIELFRMAPDRA